MGSSERVLIVVDPTREDEQACLKRGVWLAKHQDLGVDLLICDYEPQLSSDLVLGSPELASFLKTSMKKNFDVLEKMAEHLRQAGLDVAVNSLWDNPLDEGIIRHVMKTKPAFVVKETHYHHKFGRALFSNTDWNLVRQCPAPLWLAKQHPWPDNATIVASIDPTNHGDKHADLDKQILKTASTLAQQTGCDLHAFHSYISPASNPAIAVAVAAIYDESIEKNTEITHRKSVNELLENYPISQENVHIELGYADRLLPELVINIDAGLVVMGSVARNALQRVFLGSTVEKVLDKLSCDLLVVKPAWFETEVLKNPARDYDAIVADAS